MTTWFSVEGATPEETTANQERLISAWPDAPMANLEVCDLILDTAREQVIAYAPDPEESGERVSCLLAEIGYSDTAIAAVLDLLELDPPADPIKRYVYAQLGQAVNLWNAGRVDSGGEAGMDSFTFTPRPLDKTIRQIIRPTKGAPSVG